MPYRDAIESVLQRCEELREQIERIEECAVELPTIDTIEEALAWEGSLRTRLDHLAVRKRDSGPMVTVASGSGAMPEIVLPAKNLPLAAALFATVCGAMLFVVMELARAWHPATATPLPRSELCAGSVTSDAHHGDRCTVAIDDDDIDVICPTIERRFHVPSEPSEGPWVHATIPGQLDFDRRSGSLAMTDENDRVLYVQIGGWR